MKISTFIISLCITMVFAIMYSTTVIIPDDKVGVLVSKKTNEVIMDKMLKPGIYFGINPVKYKIELVDTRSQVTVFTGTNTSKKVVIPEGHHGVVTASSGFIKHLDPGEYFIDLDVYNVKLVKD